jgi:hypothetical protein
MYKLIKDEIYFILPLCAVIAIPAGTFCAFAANETNQHSVSFYFFAICTFLCYFIVPPLGMLFSFIAFFKRKNKDVGITIIRYIALFLFHFLFTVIFSGGYLYHNYFVTVYYFFPSSAAGCFVSGVSGNIDEDRSLWLDDVGNPLTHGTIDDSGQIQNVIKTTFEAQVPR